jgi:hypothetical protein
MGHPTWLAWPDSLEKTQPDPTRSMQRRSWFLTKTRLNPQKPNAKPKNWPNLKKPNSTRPMRKHGSTRPDPTQGMGRVRAVLNNPRPDVWTDLCASGYPTDFWSTLAQKISYAWLWACTGERPNGIMRLSSACQCQSSHIDDLSFQT